MTLGPQSFLHLRADDVGGAATSSQPGRDTDYSQFEVKNDSLMRDAAPGLPSVFRNQGAFPGPKGTFTKTAGNARPRSGAIRQRRRPAAQRPFDHPPGHCGADRRNDQLGGGTLTVTTSRQPAAFVLNGGVFLGSGTLNGNLTNASGEVNLGATIGVLTINGDYAQQNNLGKMRLRYDKDSATYDTILVTGSASWRSAHHRDASGMPASPTS